MKTIEWERLAISSRKLATEGTFHAKKEKVKLLSCVQLSATPWTVTHQAPLSMGFPRQEHWSGLPFPSPGMEPGSPVLRADSLLTKL